MTSDPTTPSWARRRAAATGTSGLTWVVDPIDGTVNYLYGIPSYAVSVAVVTGDPTVPGAWTAVAGAVLNPETGELFHAHLRRRRPASRPPRGTRALRATAADDLALALVGTGFGYAADLRARQAALLVELLPRVRDIRRHGSAALDLCALAAGRLDAYYEAALNPWDRAAGELVAREAGAVLGGPVDDVPDPRPPLGCGAGPGRGVRRTSSASCRRATSARSAERPTRSRAHRDGIGRRRGRTPRASRGPASGCRCGGPEMAPAPPMVHNRRAR